MLGASPYTPSSAQPSRLGFAVVAAHALLSPLVLWTGSDDAFERPKIALLHSAALALVGIAASRFLARVTSGGRQAPSLPRDLVSWGALAVVASALASTLTSASRATSVFGAERSHLGLLSIASYAALFFATRSCASDTRMRRGVIVASLVGAVGVCAYALTQLAGFDWLAWRPRWTLATRPFGPLGHPNFLGAYLAAIAPLAAWTSLACARDGRPLRALGLAGLATLFAMLCVLSLSRGAWLALAAAGSALTLGWWRAGERRGAGALLAVALLALCAGAALVWLGPAAGAAGELLSGGLAWRLASLEALAGEARLHLWSAGWRMFLDHPWLGVGLDCFSVVFDHYRTPAYWLAEWNATPSRAHGSFSQIAATLGGLGLAAYGFCIAALAIEAGRARAASTSAQVRCLRVALGAGLVAFGVQGLFSFTVAALGTLAVTQAALLVPARLEPASERVAVGPGVRALQGFAWLLVAAAWLALVGVPLHADGLHAEGRRLTAAGRPAEGALRIERAVLLDGTREAAWMDLGLAHYLAGLLEPDAGARRARLARARQVQEHVLTLAPDRGYAHSNLARTLLAQTALQPPDASAGDVRDAYDRAIGFDGANAYILRDAIHMAFLQGDLERTRRLASRCAELYPRYAPAHLYLGLAALRSADWKAAAGALEQARAGDWVVDAASGPQLARTALAAARFAQREIDATLQLAEESVQANPADHIAWTYLAAVHEQRAENLRVEAQQTALPAERAALRAESEARRAEALDAYRRAATIAPINPVARLGVERLSGPSDPKPEP